jgi:hypothetical protein
MYLKHATKYLYDGNPTLVEGIYNNREGTAEGPQNSDNDPSSQTSDPIYGVCEEQGERYNDEVNKRLNAKVSVQRCSRGNAEYRPE